MAHDFSSGDAKKLVSLIFYQSPHTLEPSKRISISMEVECEKISSEKSLKWASNISVEIIDIARVHQRRGGLGGKRGLGISTGFWTLRIT